MLWGFYLTQDKRLIIDSSKDTTTCTEYMLTSSWFLRSEPTFRSWTGLVTVDSGLYVLIHRQQLRVLWSKVNSQLGVLLDQLLLQLQEMLAKRSRKHNAINTLASIGYTFTTFNVHDVSAYVGSFLYLTHTGTWCQVVFLRFSVSCMPQQY